MNTKCEVDMRQVAIIQLQQAGLRPSIQRVAILEYINQHYTHPTIEEIYDALSKKIPTLSKTTVYWFGIMFDIRWKACTL